MIPGLLLDDTKQLLDDTVYRSSQQFITRIVAAAGAANSSSGTNNSTVILLVMMKNEEEDKMTMIDTAMILHVKCHADNATAHTLHSLLSIQRPHHLSTSTDSSNLESPT